MKAISWQKSGYPERYLKDLRNIWRYSLKTFALTGVLGLGLVAGAIWGPVPDFLAAVGLVVFLIFGLLGGLGGLYDTWRYVRIIPYFQQPVGEIDTFLAGEALARYFEQLEEIARNGGSIPLSMFGFNDDLRNEKLTWHPAVAGLKTVQELQAQLHQRANVPRQLLADLVKLEHALQRAHDKNIPFCLLIRVGNSTSGQEWDVRQGTAF